MVPPERQDGAMSQWSGHPNAWPVDETDRVAITPLADDSPGLFDGLEHVASLEAVTELTSGDEVQCRVGLEVGIWYPVIPHDMQPDRARPLGNPRAEFPITVEAAIFLLGELETTCPQRRRTAFP